MKRILVILLLLITFNSIAQNKTVVLKVASYNISNYKLISDTGFNNGYTTRVRLKQYGDSLALTKQNAFTQGISGYIPKWTSASGLDTSQIRQVNQSIFIGPYVTTSGKLVVNSPLADNHIRILGANSPSLRISEGGVSPTKEIGLGLATGVNDFILGSISGDYCIINSSLTSSGIVFGIYNGSTTVEKFRVDNTFSNFKTNVGIGNSNPQGKLHITGNTPTQVVSIIENNDPTTTGGTRLSFKYNGTETGAIYNRFNGLNFNTDIISLDYIRLLTAGVERVRISATGPVDVLSRLNVSGATDNSNVALNVEGGIKAKGYTVATLPTGVTGLMVYVTDALSPTYNATVVGGGAIVVPVFYNGTNWTCH